MARLCYLALLLPVLALAACGGNDKSASETSATRGLSEQQGTTGPQTGATGATGTRDARRKRTVNRKRTANRKRTVDRKRTVNRKQGAGPSATRPAAPKEPTTTNERPEQDSSTPQELTAHPEQLKQFRRALKAQAYQACKSYGLEALADDLHSKSRKLDDVARDYAASWAVPLRQAVAAGCKAGLLDSK
jgi:hypothetical protein